jgi:hypothetical protein
MVSTPNTPKPNSSTKDVLLDRLVIPKPKRVDVLSDEELEKRRLLRESEEKRLQITSSPSSPSTNETSSSTVEDTKTTPIGPWASNSEQTSPLFSFLIGAGLVSGGALLQLGKNLKIQGKPVPRGLFLVPFALSLPWFGVSALFAANRFDTARRAQTSTCPPSSQYLPSFFFHRPLLISKCLLVLLVSCSLFYFLLSTFFEVVTAGSLFTLGITLVRVPKFVPTQKLGGSLAILASGYSLAAISAAHLREWQASRPLPPAQPYHLHTPPLTISSASSPTDSPSSEKSS